MYLLYGGGVHYMYFFTQMINVDDFIPCLKQICLVSCLTVLSEVLLNFVLGLAAVKEVVASVLIL